MNNKHRRSFFQGVAPESLVRRDFAHLVENDRLDTDEETTRLILLQSIEGHAHNGDSTFHKLRFVNTTTHDVVKLIHMNPFDVKTKRQTLIDRVFDFIKEACKGKKTRSFLVDARGKPLLGIPWFEKTEVDIPSLMKGIYIGGLRDDADVRKTVENKYGIKIGGGKCYFVDYKIMEEMDLDGETLAHGEYEDKIDEFRKKGLVVDKLERPDLEEVRYRYMYIRHRRGPGSSDDAAIVVAGLMFNIDVAMGVFISDAVDTLEKYIVDYRDWDDELAFYVRDYFPGFEVSDEDVHRVTYACTAPESDTKYKAIPDSSLRYLLLIDPKTGRTALQNHLAFIQGKPFSRTILSHGKHDAREFYSYVKKRIADLEISVVTPEIILKKLRKRVGDCVLPLEKHPGCTIVSPDVTLGDAISKMQKEKGKFLVIMEDGKVIGILEDEDLLHMVV